MININVEKARKIIDSDKFMEGVVKYRYIMSKLNKCDISQNIEFQCIFNDFYGMNMVNKEKFPVFLKTYYSFMEQNKNRTNVEFGEIIRYLFDKAGMVTPSFSSKMLHTINRDMPIWDENVLRNLGLFGEEYSDISDTKKIMTINLSQAGVISSL